MYLSAIRSAGAAALALLFSLPAHGETWQAHRLKVPGGTITKILSSPGPTGPRTFFRANGRWLELTACADNRFCLTPRRPALAKKAPKGGLPDGFIASQASSTGPVSAWYAKPTRAYSHGILGDRVEASALTVRLASGKRFSVDAGSGHVFEDLTPRLADLDGDGRNEIIVIRTNLRRGAALAVYGQHGGGLELLAATADIGRANRWRNPALIFPSPASDEMLIAEVVTPHIGGTLKLWALKASTGSGYRLEPRGSASGFSNHFIGSRELGLMAAGGNGLIAVPSGDRSALRIMQAGKGRLTERGRVKLPGRIEHALGVLQEPSGPVFLAGLDDGSVYAVSRPDP